jgi:DNA-binding transcriptional LysR family regulator
MQKEQRTITSAAEHLGYTASAVSQQLSSAERSTGVAMLERVGRNVLLTDAGRELVSHAEIVLEQLEYAQAAIERVQGDVSGIMRLGFIESISSTLLGPIMTLLRSRHPNLKLRTMGVDGVWPAEVIRAGELDVSFVVGLEGDPSEVEQGFDRIDVFRDWFRLVIPASRYSKSPPPDKLSLSSLAGEDFIAPPADEGCGRAAVEACRKAGLDPFVAHRVSDYPTTLRLVAAEAGVALIPDLGLRNVPDGITVVDLEEPTYRTIQLLYRTSSAARPAVRALIDVVNAVADEMELDRAID